MSATATPIGIAVVEHNGRYLVGIRGPDGPLAGLAEFPGGKCHAGESPRECALRECLEETGLAVDPVRLLCNRQFDYEHGSVDLYFWLCRLRDGQEIATDHKGFRWRSQADLPTLNFPAGNADAIALLTSE